MKIKKRAISLLLVLVMVAGLFVGISFDVEAEDYKLRVGGVQVTDVNKSHIVGGDGYASYDSENNILTLNNYSYSGPGWTAQNPTNGNGGIVFDANKDLTINLVGENNIECTYNDTNAGILVSYGNLVVTGNGSLNVSGASINAAYSSGIAVVEGNLTLKTKNDINIIGGNVGDFGSHTYGLFAEEGVDIISGNVSISAGNNNQGSLAVKAGQKSLKNSIKGVGYDTIEEPTGTPIDVNTTGTTYNYKKITFSSPKATVDTQPTGKTLTYDGTEQQLVTLGQATGGALQYALGTETEATTDYSAEIPTGKDVKTYYVWYKAVGDETHFDSDANYVTAKINSVNPPAPVNREVLDGAGQTVYYGDKAKFRFDADYDQLFKNGGKVYVDDKELDSSNYEEGKGSTIITLTESFIKTLSEDTHKIQVVFNDDSTGTTSFTVKKADAPNTDNGSSAESGTATASTPPTTTPTSTTSKVTSPKTSDTIPIVAILILALGIGTIGIAAYKKRD